MSGARSHAAAYRRRSSPGFNFTGAIRRVVEDMAGRLPELAHLDTNRIAVAFCQARKRVRHGLYASLTPMRFEGGSRFTTRRGKRMTVQQLYDENGCEMLYILSFYLPRFMDTDFREKVVTILHELWHINPDFNGDIRRHEGRCYVHTHSQAKYDAEMGRIADRWLALDPPEETYHFLHHNFTQLCEIHGGMHGIKVRQPKLIPAATAPC